MECNLICLQTQKPHTNENKGDNDSEAQNKNNNNNMKNFSMKN